MTMRSWLALVGLAVAAGCSSSGPEADPAAAECAAGDVRVERFKELMVVDESVVTDARALNANSGAWSFRHAVEQMAPVGVDPGRFVLDWLNQWKLESLNGYRLDRVGEERTSTIDSRLVCPWLKLTPSNECDANCFSCKEQKLDLAKAPFRLLAISNRLDLTGRPGIESPFGEGRLVFGVTTGPADEGGPAAAMTVIFEYTLPTTETLRTAADWARAWHKLGTHAAFDEDYKRSLEALTNEFTKRGAIPSRSNGSAISQVRSNESLFNWIWQLREFKLETSLRLAPLLNTPAEALNGTDQLKDYITNNKTTIARDEHVLPTWMRPGSVDLMLFRWQVPGIDEPTRRAFSAATCNGCHAQENPAVDTAFHVSPFRKGTEKLSPFVNNPLDPANDDLAKRAAFLTKTMCSR